MCSLFLQLAVINNGIGVAHISIKDKPIYDYSTYFYAPNFTSLYNNSYTNAITFSSFLRIVNQHLVLQIRPLHCITNMQRISTSNTKHTNISDILCQLPPVFLLLFLLPFLHPQKQVQFTYVLFFDIIIYRLQFQGGLKHYTRLNNMYNNKDDQ